MASNSNEGICHICGKAGNLSFEHIPPRSVGNVNPSKAYSVVDIVEHVGRFDLSNKQGIKYRQEQRGSGFATICSECNSYLGKHYVPEYKGFHSVVAKLLLSNPELQQANGLRIETDNINVLALFKHIVSNFCATTQLGSMHNCKEFLLDYSSNAFPSRFRVFMFSVPETDVGMFTSGWTTLCTSADMKDHYTVAYLAMFPLGFTLLDTQSSTVGSENLGCEITPMAARKWSERPHVILELPHMDLKSGFPVPFSRTN